VKFFGFLQHDLKKGIFFVVIGWFIFSTMYTVSKLIENQTTVPTMLFFRNVLGLIGVMPWIIKDWPQSILLKRWSISILRGFAALLNLTFIFLAIQRISLINTTLLNNSGPFFVPFILLFWLKVPINHKLWPAIIAGFIGITLILEPTREIFNLGALFGILSGFCVALSIITMRISTKAEKFSSVIFYFFLIGIIATTPFAIFYWKIDNFYTLLGLLSIGLFSAVGQIFLFQGLKFAKAHQLAPFTYSTVIFSGFYEWILWGQTPKPLAYVGILLIFAAGIWIVWISRTPKKIT